MHSDSLTSSDLGMGKKTLGTYLFGVALGVVLTLIPFMVIFYHHEVSRAFTLFIIFTSAILQFLVQVVCFLRLTFKTEQGGVNIYSFIFTIFVLAAIVGGSIWIMINLNYNMMH